MSGITLKESNPVDIPTPDAGKDTVFIDSTAVPPVPSYKNSSGVVTTLKGSIGVTGVQGPAGPAGFALDGDDGQFIISQPGPQGNTGPTGAQGPLGPVVFVSDGLDGEQGFSVPGPQGPSGAGGASDWDATITKAVDDTITNSATLTNDSELVTAALVSGGVYRFEFFIIY